MCILCSKKLKHQLLKFNQQNENHKYCSIYHCSGCSCNGGGVCQFRKNVSEHHHDESLQMTSYNNLFEVFAEVSPLVVGNEAEIVAHFTWIDGFKPLESGTVTATINVGGKTISQSAEMPARQGIYKLKITPDTEGEGSMVFVVKTNGEESTLTVNNIKVYRDEHEAQHAAAKSKATSSNGVVFTKEMSWKVNFATDSCRKMPFDQVINTMGRVQPSQGDEYAVAAKTSGIVALNGEITEGKMVKKGQVLFTIESNGLAEGDLNVRLREAENNYLLAKAEYERKQALAKDNIVSASELQQAANAFENAKSEYQHLKNNFSGGRQNVVAPVSG